MMSRFLPLAIGLRYFRSRHTSLRFVTRITTMGLILAVAVLLLCQAVMSGFLRAIEDEVLAVVPHFSLIATQSTVDTSRADKVVESLEGVEDWAPAVEATVMLVAPSRAEGVRLIGIDPANYLNVSELGEYVDGPGFDELGEERFNLILGDDVARKLGVGPGDTIVVVFPQAKFTPLGMLPSRKTFTIVSLFDTKTILDRNVAVANISDLSAVMRLGGAANVVQFRTANPAQAQEHAMRAWGHFSDQDVFAISWRWAYGDWLMILRDVKNIFFLIMSLLVVVATFNLVSALVILVHERRADIAILRTMGGHGSLVVFVFMVAAACIALIGIALGTVLAILMGICLEMSFPFLTDLLGLNLLGEFVFQSFTVDVNFQDVSSVAALSVCLSVLASIYPALKASRANPAEILQYE